MGKAKGKARRQQLRRQSKKSRRRFESKSRGRPAKTLQEFHPMSRSTDVAFIENQIAALRGEIQEVQQVYAGYHKEVGQRIRDVLEAAEVYDQVRSLEEVRSGVQQKAQAKANQLQAKINQLAATRQFLLNREEAEPEEVTPTEDTPTEETPDEVSENGKAPVKLLTELDVLRQQVQEAQAKKPVETRPELKKVPVPPNFG